MKEEVDEGGGGEQHGQGIVRWFAIHDAISCLTPLPFLSHSTRNPDYPSPLPSFWQVYDSKVELAEVSELRLGQNTKVFSSNPIPEHEDLSFSLIYSGGNRSLDIVCKVWSWTVAPASFGCLVFVLVFLVPFGDFLFEQQRSRNNHIKATAFRPTWKSTNRTGESFTSGPPALPPSSTANSTLKNFLPTPRRFKLRYVCFVEKFFFFVVANGAFG